MSHWERRISAALILGLFLPVLSNTSSPASIRLAQISVADALSQLPVKGRAAKTGFSRDQFGPAWSDVDHNGCDTRNDILKRDLINLTFKERTNQCVILTGTLLDKYSGEQIAFTRGVSSSMEVQIDHVVALSNAWFTGAYKLSDAQRKALANDPLNLFAVKGRLNSQKSDGDAATWLPPLKSFRCAYVSQQVAVKKKYKLWVTAPEKAAIIKILSSCPKQQLPTK
jgi:hypothetical protein